MLPIYAHMEYYKLLYDGVKTTAHYRRQKSRIHVGAVVLNCILRVYPDSLCTCKVTTLLSSSESPSLISAFGLKGTSFVPTLPPVKTQWSAETTRSYRKPFGNLFTQKKEALFSTYVMPQLPTCMFARL